MINQLGQTPVSAKKPEVVVGTILQRWEVLARLPDGIVILYTVPAISPNEAVVKLVNSPDAWVKNHPEGTFYEVLSRGDGGPIVLPAPGGPIN